MTLVFALFLMLLPGPEAGPDLCPLAAELNGRIERHTPYAPPVCPEIGFSDLPAGGALRSQAGAFFPKTGAIQLAPDLDLTTAYGQSFLLHELVHAAQYANRAHARARCPARLEAEAYYLQADFLQDHDLPRDAVMMRLLADQLGSCPD